MGSGKAAGSRRWLRRGLWTLAVVGVLTFGLWDVESRHEFCALCGKDRSVVVLRVPRVRLSQEEHVTLYSSALEPLVHGNGTKHRWKTWRSGSPLGAPVRLYRNLRYHYHLCYTWVLAHTWESVKAAAACDPELAVAAGQYFLAPCWDSGRSAENAEDLEFAMKMAFVARTDTEHDQRRWNEARRLVGLPELSPAQMEALASSGQ